MRWLVWSVLLTGLLTGCLRARATVVHPTGMERSGGSSSQNTIARQAPHAATEVSQPEERGSSTNLGSVELGALIPFSELESAYVHVAPGVRIFGSDSVLWGVAVGADFLGKKRRGTGFALEGSVHAGTSSAPGAIQVAMDVFAGITLHPKRSSSSIAVGPSLGILGMPGGQSGVMLGLGLRLTGASGL